MNTVAMIAIIASALFHSSYNMLIKASDEKTLFMWSIFSVAVAAGWIAGWIAVPGFPVFEPSVLLLAAISAAFFTSYHLSTAKAYASDEGDLSLSCPIRRLLRIGRKLSATKRNPKEKWKMWNDQLKSIFSIIFQY